jgi:TfoX/Sxy family transcriptional regulator of competence genes
LLASVPDATERPMFGQPAAFLSGNLFFGVYGGSVFVRLGEKDGADAARELRTSLFEPMPGRPMRGYVVLPRSVLEDQAAAVRWVRKAAQFVRTLPPKHR